MASQERMIPSLNDSDLIGAFKAVVKQNPDLVVKFGSQFGTLDTEDEEEGVRKLGGYFLRTATLRYQSASWTWYRGSDHPGWDRLQFGFNQQQGRPDPYTVAKISADLDKALARPLVAGNPDGLSGASANQATHREVLLALEGAVARLVSDTADYRRELDSSFASKEEALIQRVEDQRKAEIERLASEKQRADSELARRQAAIDERQAELDARQKQLDDRNNTHVRREIRSSLMTLTKDRLDNFSVSKATRVQYFTVQAVCVAGLLALVSGAFYFAAQAAPSLDGSPEVTVPDYVQWAMWAKAGLLLTMAVAIGSWYLKWLNRWLQRIADAEFKLQQFRLDIERASWLAETVLEWKSMSEEPFPDLLVTRLSTGLFEAGHSHVDDPKSPATQLAEALLGSAASARIKIGDQELAFDRRGLRKLKEQGAASIPDPPG